MKNQRLQDGLVLSTFTVALVFLLYNFSRIGGWFSNLLSILTPFIVGFVLAYLLNRPFLFFQKKVVGPLLTKLGKNAPKENTVRAWSLLITYLAVGLGVTAFFSVIIPQLVTSILTLVEAMPSYLTKLEELTDMVWREYSLGGVIMDWINQYWSQLLDAFTKFVSNLAPVLMNAAKGITSRVVKTSVGVVVSVYMLWDSRKLSAQCKRALYALVPHPVADRTLEILSLTHSTFGSFIGGQMMVSFILGTLCAVCMTLLRIPYALLSGMIVGTTNMIPYFGPFLGAIPCTFFILVESPIKALIFVVLVVLLQQVDNNFISPRIVGGSVGLSGIWVLFAITVGGSLFGIPGMVVGLPTFAVIYTLIGQYIQRRLNKKGITPEELET